MQKHANELVKTNSCNRKYTKKIVVKAAMLYIEINIYRRKKLENRSRLLIIHIIEKFDQIFQNINKRHKKIYFSVDSAQFFCDEKILQ